MGLEVLGSSPNYLVPLFGSLERLVRQGLPTDPYSMDYPNTVALKGTLICKSTLGGPKTPGKPENLTNYDCSIARTWYTGHPNKKVAYQCY